MFPIDLSAPYMALKIVCIMLLIFLPILALMAMTWMVKIEGKKEGGSGGGSGGGGGGSGGGRRHGGGGGEGGGDFGIDIGSIAHVGGGSAEQTQASSKMNSMKQSMDKVNDIKHRMDDKSGPSKKTMDDLSKRSEEANVKGDIKEMEKISKEMESFNEKMQKDQKELQDAMNDIAKERSNLRGG